MVETQIAEFAGCVYAGILIGFVFELFNLIIRITNAKKVMTAVLDGVCILVCIVIAAVSLYILWRICGGHNSLFNKLSLFV